MAKSKEQIFDEKIAPLLEQIHEICNKYDIASLNAFQLVKDEKEGVKMSLSGTKSADIIPQMEVAGQILSGNVSVMAVPAREAMDLGLTEGVMTLIKKHAQECPECSMKISAAEATGQKLSIEDFQHEKPSKVSDVTAEVAAAENESESVVKVIDKKIQQSAVLSDLFANFSN